MTKKRPLSVIMSCYNEVAVIGRAIESILNQTFIDFEFIIVDDGSTDGTFEICSAYANKDDRIRLFQLAENSGSCTIPLNFAITKATAPILARMDADDISHLNRFEKQYDFLKRHNEVDVLGTGANLINKASGALIRTYYFSENHKEIIRKRYLKPFLLHPSVMLRKAVYDASNGYDTKWRRGQDTDLWLKSFSIFTFHNLQEVLFDYYQTTSAKRSTKFKRMINDLSIKYQSMSRNRELLRFWPILLVDIVLFLLGKK